MTGRVLVRARSGPRVGMGHVMRSRAVAREVVEMGGRAIVVVDDSRTAWALSEESFEVRLAAEPWPEGRFEGAWLDGFVPWEEELDRLDRIGTPAFLVENRVADRDRAHRVVYPALHFVPDDWDLAHRARILAGASWVPLTEEILGRNGTAVRDIGCLVTFGGSDPNELTERVLPRLDFVPGDLVIGVGHHMTERRARIEALAAGLSRSGRDVRVLDPGASLAPWMARSRTALTALGTTLYELAFLEVPALILANWGEDRPALDWYREHGPHVPVGVIHDLGEDDLENALQEAWHEAVERQVHRPRGLGEGTVRLARALLRP